eukprot:1140115-Pelagomonas_calceolata.AAC.18
MNGVVVEQYSAEAMAGTDTVSGRCCYNCLVAPTDALGALQLAADIYHVPLQAMVATCASAGHDSNGMLLQTTATAGFDLKEEKGGNYGGSTTLPRLIKGQKGYSLGFVVASALMMLFALMGIHEFLPSLEVASWLYGGLCTVRPELCVRRTSVRIETQQNSTIKPHFCQYPLECPFDRAEMLGD